MSSLGVGLIGSGYMGKCHALAWNAARASGRVAVLGYNYIQNPLIRHMGKLLAEGVLGTVHSVRIEMDEDFMADPEAPFSRKSAAGSGFGALDDFGVHPLSLLAMLFGLPEAVMADLAKPFAMRQTADGGRRAVETWDIANILLRLPEGVSGTILLSRSAWGRKGRLAVQVFGSRGSLVYDQERMNELALFTRDGGPGVEGFRTILAAPAHPPYDRSVAAPGHGWASTTSR